MRVCIPIIAETEEMALRKMSRPLPEDCFLEILFELRADRMREIKLEKILKEKGKKIVVTNRLREEGGGFQGTEKERISYLLKAVDLGADYVDIEASTDAALLAKVKAAIADQGFKTLLIVSSHDFVNPPSEGSLIQKLEESAALAPDIVKIVSRADTQDDNLKVLGLIPYARKNGQEIISFCMGDKGRMSRVMSLFLGAYMGFASLSKGEESASGQLSLAEMITVLSTLSGAPGEIPGAFRGQAGKELFGV
jgi:3-dehydroquinate dehydratase type I